MAIEKTIKLNVDANNAVKNVDNLNKSIEKVDDSQDKLTKSQNASKKASQRNAAAFEGMNKATGGALRGVRALIKQMWLLVANPVGLVIAAIALALTTLYKAFTSTKAGAELLDRVMAGISSTIDVLRDRVLVVGEALKKFFSGDFKGAIETGKKAVSGFGAEVAKEFKIAMDATKSLQEVADAMRELGVSRAELDRDLIKAKETIESSTASYADKKKAIDEVRKAETKQTNAELANAQKKLDAIIAQNKQSDSSAEDLDKEAEARKVVISLQATSSRNKTKFNKLEEMADREELSRKKEIQTELAAIEKQKEDDFNAFVKRGEEIEKQNKLDDDKRQKEKEQRAQDNADFEEWLDEEEQIEIDAEDRRIANAWKAAQKQIKIEEAVAKAKEDIRNAELDNIGKAFNLLSQLAGKNKALQAIALIGENAVGIAKQVINTKAANAAVTLKYALLPGGEALAQAAKAANNVSLGIGIASSVAATAQGLSALGKGGNTGGGTSLGGDSGAGQTAPQLNVVGASDTNQLAQSISTQSQEPIKAIVVASEVTSQQALDRQITDTATFG